MAAFSAVAGYTLTGYGPLWIGAQSSVSAAGMIAAISGLLMGLACLFGQQRYGASVARAACLNIYPIAKSE